MEMGRGGACVPARVAPQRRIHRYPPRTMRDAQNLFPVWKRRCADVRAGTQAPPLRFRLGRLRADGWYRLGELRVGRLMSFGWIACVILLVGKTVHKNQYHRCCTFDSPRLIERSEIYPG